MKHLSNNKVIGMMVFYSILTFFVGPFLTRPLLDSPIDQCVGGFLLGFTISVLLWMKIGQKYVSAS
tara:strand:+ start:82 stop:279 length:198 start_codon:yes stop_codon:yes gene_type:complete